jgi:hypothetical protein
MWAACWAVYLRMLTPWVLHGELVEAGQAEGFLRRRAAPPTPTCGPARSRWAGMMGWLTRVSDRDGAAADVEVDAARVPPFLSATQVEAVLFCGRAMPTLRGHAAAAVGEGDGAWDAGWLSLQRQALADDGVPVPTLLRALDVILQQTHARASHALLQLLRGPGHLAAHLQVVHRGAVVRLPARGRTGHRLTTSCSVA